MMGDTYLYVQTVAKRLKCSERTVYRLIGEGQLPAIRFGGRSLRIPEREFEKFISESAVDAEQASAL